MGTRTRHRHQFVRVLVSLLIAVSMAAPAFLVYVLSFSTSRFFAVSGTGFSLEWFSRALTPQWLGAFGTSILLASIVSFGAVTIAAPAAFYRVRVGSHFVARMIELGALVLLLVPPISLAVGYFRMYGEHSVFTLVLGHTVLAFPYAYFSLLAGFRRIDPEVMDAAELLGTSPWATMFRVMLPASRRYVLLGLVLAFLISWDESVLSIFTTDPNLVTLPKLTWESVQRERDLTPAAINAVIAPFLSLAILLLFVPRRNDRKLKTDTV